MKCKWLSAIILTLSLTLVLAMVVMAEETTQETTNAANESTELTISEGVYIGEVNVSGLTEEEAKAAVDEYINQFITKQAVLAMDSNQATVTVAELGYYWSNTDVVKEAVSLCKIGNVIKRYKDKKDVEKESKVYEITYDVNTDILTQTINTYCGQFNNPHENPTIVKEGSSFKVEGQEQNGRIIDVTASIEQIKSFLLNTWNKQDTSISLVVVDDMPSTSVADCEKVKDVLGTYSTHFSTAAANYNRNMNMRNGAKLINGTVIYPGETFSANEILSPFTASNGYYSAGTYENGKVVDSIGGGICQVSSTLYNSVLLSELEVVQRSNHSMSVGYVPLAQDAALAGTWKDLKFTNNTSIPIYIEAIYGEGTLTFTIYGQETRSAQRTIQYVSETISSTPYEEILTEDPAFPAGYRVVTQNGHTGYVAKLWKYVFINGEQQSVELVNTSSYQTSPSHVTIGTGAAEAVQPETAAPTQPSTETSTTAASTEAPVSQ